MPKSSYCNCTHRQFVTMATSNNAERRINPHLQKLPSDFLYHIGYSRDDVKQIFHDVKFVVMGGSANRMGSFAELIAKEIGHHDVERHQLDISKTDRFSFYKIGPVISVNHGMGVPSVTILLHEILKLLYYAEANDPVIFRIGTCGGIGVPGGTLVVSEKAVNAYLREEHDTVILGKKISRQALLNKELAETLVKLQDDKTFNTILGTTMCTDDFYEGQARVDGAFCDFTEEDRIKYLHELQGNGVVNIEMEATAMASLCYKAGVKCAIVCVTLLDRLQGDQVEITEETYKKFQSRPQGLVATFIRTKLKEQELEEN